MSESCVFLFSDSSSRKAFECDDDWTSEHWGWCLELEKIRKVVKSIVKLTTLHAWRELLLLLSSGFFFFFCGCCCYSCCSCSLPSFAVCVKWHSGIASNVVQCPSGYASHVIQMPFGVIVILVQSPKKKWKEKKMGRRRRRQKKVWG